MSKELGSSITIASIIMMASVLLSRVLGLVREQVFAYYGGTSGEMDAYVASFLIPELLNHFLAGGFLSITFIPIFQKYMKEQNEKRAWEVFNNLLTIGSALLILLITVAMIFTPQIVHLLGPKIAYGPLFDLTVQMTRIVMPAQLFFYWGALFMAVQYSKRQFFFPALAPLVYNAGIILGGIVLYPRFGIAGFSWGVLAGAFAGNVLLQLPAALRSGLKYRPTCQPSDPDFKQYLMVTLPLIFGVGISFSNEFLFRYFGSFLESGSMASLNYALRTMLMIVAVFGQASGVASYPFLSQLALEHKFEEMNRLLKTILSRLLYILAPLSATAMALSVPLITVLFEHGRFSAVSTSLTAPILILYLFASLPLAATMIVLRTFYATQDTVTPMVISTIVFLVSLPVYWYMSHTVGARGIALTAAITATVQCGILLVVWNRRHCLVTLNKNVVKKIAVSVGAAGIAFCVAWLIRNQIELTASAMDHRIRALLICGLAGTASLIAAGALYHATGVQKFGRFIKMARGK